MPTTTLPNHAIHFCATSYYDAANHLDALQVQTGAFLVQPTVHMRAIAIELFLKSLWLENEHIPLNDTTAELSHLSLPKYDKNGPGHNLTESFKRIRKPWRRTLIALRPSVEIDLKSLKGLFVTSRYFYELKKERNYVYTPTLNNLDVQSEVAAFLHEVIKNLTPIEV